MKGVQVGSRITELPKRPGGVAEISRLARATRPMSRGFQHRKTLPERLLLLPPSGDVPDDGHGPEHLSIGARGQDDGELDGEEHPP